MGNYATVNSSELELTAGTFYGRITPAEADMVRATVDDVAGYLKRLERGPFLIAGVGSVLRFEDPELAKDIDLAVVGLKYTKDLGKSRTHTFDQVINFTECVEGYFKRLVAKLKEGREEYSLLQGSDTTFSTGSGPFEGWNDGFAGRKDGSSVEVRSHLEEFGGYDSKGLQIKHQGSRPVDAQFSFNQTPEEWKRNQEGLRNSLFDHGEKSDKFFYEILLEH